MEGMQHGPKAMQSHTVDMPEWKCNPNVPCKKAGTVERTYAFNYVIFKTPANWLGLAAGCPNSCCKTATETVSEGPKSKTFMEGRACPQTHIAGELCTLRYIACSLIKPWPAGSTGNCFLRARDITSGGDNSAWAERVGWGVVGGFSRKVQMGVS